MAKIVLKKAPISSSITDIVTNLRIIRNNAGFSSRVTIPDGLAPDWTKHPLLRGNIGLNNVLKLTSDSNNTSLCHNLAHYISSRYPFEPQLKIANTTTNAMSPAFSSSDLKADWTMCITNMDSTQGVRFTRVLNRYFYFLNKALISRKIPYIFDFSLSVDANAEKHTLNPTNKLKLFLNIRATLLRIINPVLSELTSPNFEIISATGINADGLRALLASSRDKLDEDAFILEMQKALKRRYLQFIDGIYPSGRKFSLRIPGDYIQSQFSQLEKIGTNIHVINQVKVNAAKDSSFMHMHSVTNLNNIETINSIILQLNSTDPTILTEEEIGQIVEACFKFNWHSSKMTLYSQYLANMLDNISRRILNGSLRSSFIS
jgi:hypothetical protein